MSELTQQLLESKNESMTMLSDSLCVLLKDANGSFGSYLEHICTELLSLAMLLDQLSQKASEISDLCFKLRSSAPPQTNS